MKWNDLPLWLKALIIFFTVYVILYFFQRRAKLYEEWLNKQKELKELILERNKLLQLKAKIELYTKIFTKTLTVVSIVLFLLFVLVLKVATNTDLLSALTNSAGAVGFFYLVTSVLIKNRLININNLLEKLSQEIESAFMKRFGFVPSRLTVVELRIIELQQQSMELKNKINPSNKLSNK